MRDSRSFVIETLPAAVDELCRKFGVWATARALIVAAWRRRQTTGQISQLTNLQRRDIGLPEKEDDLLEGKLSLWNTRPPLC
jgi:hypothetical protein